MAEEEGGDSKSFPVADAIAMRLIGWGAIGGAVTEYIDPHLLFLSADQAAGLGAFGVLAATGAGRAIRRFIVRGLGYV